MMLPNMLAIKKLKTEIIKLAILSFLIISGGVILAIFIPLREFLSWTEFIFYVAIGLLVISYQAFSFYFRTRKIKNTVETDFREEIKDNVPTIKPDNFSERRTNRSLKLNENVGSYCPRCGSSFSKTYQFCPKCSFVGILKKVK